MGGSVYANSVGGVAAKPAGTTGNFLAAGTTPGQPARLTFDTPLSSIGFLWGSPDVENRVEVPWTGGASKTFKASDLSFSLTNGNQAFAQYVRFDSDEANFITGLVFTNHPSRNAFEVSNFSVPAGGAKVPEPATTGLLAAGLIGLAGVVRRRRVS